jgi:hypothetical protein
MSPAMKHYLNPLHRALNWCESDKRTFVVRNTLPDNGGRRSGIGRRKFSYSAHIPERRTGFDRRKCIEDRRCGDKRRVWKTDRQASNNITITFNKAELSL